MTLPLQLDDVVLRLLVATFVGGALGLDREVRGKPAGLRTHALVALGAALVTLVGVEIAHVDSSPGDAISRVVQGIIAGVGFLGGGAILKARNGDEVRGLTTAASIWLVASLGIACGVGRWRAALVALVLALVVLIVGGPVEGAVHRIFRTRQHREEPKVDEA